MLVLIISWPDVDANISRNQNYWEEFDKKNQNTVGLALVLAL